MKKKIIGLLLGSILIGNLFAGRLREQSGTDYEINLSSNVIITVSSTTYKTLAYSKPINGVERRLFNESDTITIRYKYAGATSTITTEGFALDPKTGIYDNTNFETIYVQAVDGSANLSYMQLERK